MTGEELSMRLPVLLPARDIRNEHARAHHIFQVRAQLLQGALDDLQATTGLGVGITRSDTAPVLVDRGRPANTYQITGAYGAAVADLPFPGRAGEYALEWHWLASSSYFIASGSARPPPCL
jgi:hypothetical protein